MSYHSILKGFLGFAIVVGVAGCGISAMGAVSERSTGGRPVLAAERTPAEAIAEIQNLGGSFTRDANSPDQPVISVVLHGGSVTDTALERLRGLTELRRLVLSLTKITDSGLKQLEGLSQLRLLDLGKTQVTDTGLKHLKGLTELHSLRLRGTQVTEAG